MIVVLDVLLFAVVVGERGDDSLRGVRGENGVVSGWMIDGFLF